MLFLASDFINYKVVSISTLSEVGQVAGILVDPYRFVVSGCWVKILHSRRYQGEGFLVSSSIRQIDDQRVLINDVDDCSPAVDLPKLKPIFKIDYQIKGKRIISTEKATLGRAEDFSFNDQDFKIMHIIVNPPLLQRLRLTQKRYHRQQIEKIDHKSIEVKVGPQTQSIQSLPTGLTV